MLKRVQFQEQKVSLLQDNVDTELTKLQSMPMVGGNMLQNISLTSGADNLIRHGLDHVASYFIVSMVNVNTAIWSPTSTDLNGRNSDDTFINLRCSTSCTASIWVN